MKTYNLIYALLALVIIGCSKSDNPGSGGGDDDPGVDAAYNLLVTEDGMLTSTLVNATEEVTTLNPATSPFEDMLMPDLAYTDGLVLTTYHKDTDCSGKLSQFDFSDNSSKNLDLFSDLTDCELTATAVAHSSDMFYIAYWLEDTSEYFVRAIDPNKTESNFTDIALKAEPQDPTYIPKELVFANNRLFILGHDEEATDEYHVLVLDAATDNLIHNVNLGFNVKQIFKNPEENIIISYDELHTELDSGSMAVEYHSYEPATNPHFTDSKYNPFDQTGRMYYEMPPGSHSTYAIVPAVYDFEEKLAVIYAYENFLTEAERNFEFEIESTTMVGYDEKNDYILIGYKKTGSANKGGLMRIKQAPEPALIDNLDVDGIPYKLFVR
ncbi:MAG: hypothetical protein ACR2MT_14985 [Aurantibacter sp.]